MWLTMDQSAPTHGLDVVATKTKKNIIEEKFAPCLKVILPDRTFVMVPIDKLASDAKRQILVAKAREFVVSHMDRLASASLTPAEVRDLVRAVTDVDGLQREQYLATSKADSPLGRSLQNLVHDVARGAVEGSAAAFMEKKKRLDEAAKKVMAIQPIDV